MEQNQENSVLLIMDMQTAIVRNISNSEELIKNVSKAISVARDKKIPVIYVRVGFRHGTPEIGKNNKSFSNVRERFANISVEEFMKIHPALTPGEGEIVVTKRRTSAFAGSDLEIILRALGIQHMILTGVATSGVVLSTAREAADKDYRLTILSDCCADADDEVHRVLTSKVFPRQADVITVDAWSKM